MEKVKIIWDNVWYAEEKNDRATMDNIIQYKTRQENSHKNGNIIQVPRRQYHIT